MWIVAIAWMYVVVLIAATDSSVAGAIMTLLFYGVLPLSLLSYFFGAKGRRARHEEKVRAKVRAKVPENVQTMGRESAGRNEPRL